MTSNQAARAFCLWHGLDPDELVCGYLISTLGSHRIRQPRWIWYIGAKPGD